MAEYDPQPATTFGSPDSVPPELGAAVCQQFDQMAPDLAELRASSPADPRREFVYSALRAREGAR
jgi:hypothetical protein